VFVLFFFYEELITCSEFYRLYEFLILCDPETSTMSGLLCITIFYLHDGTFQHLLLKILETANI